MDVRIEDTNIWGAVRVDVIMAEINRCGAVTVEVIMEDTNIWGAVSVDVIMAEIKS